MQRARSLGGGACLCGIAVGVAMLASGSGMGAQRSTPEGPCSIEDPALFHPCALAKAGAFVPPLTADGRPDLQGFWRGQSSGTENIEEHPETPADDGGKSLIVDPPDGKVPYQPWAVTRPAEHRARFVEPNIACFPSGVPRSLYVPTDIEILQSSQLVLMLFERAHTYRIIPTTGTPHVGEGIRLWQGDSRGRWEGNTLVVDVTNHNARPWFDQAGNFYSSGAHMVERFTLAEPDIIHYQVTIDDPNVYTRPWTMAFPLTRNTAPGFRLLEEACHEGERNVDPLIEAGQRIYPGIEATR